MSASTWLYSDNEVPEAKPEMLAAGFRKAEAMSFERCFACEWCGPAKSASTGVVLMSCTQWFQEVADDMVCDHFGKSEEVRAA